MFKAINIVLLILAIILFLNLIMPLKSITGDFIFFPDLDESACFFRNSDQISRIPEHLCCDELQKQLNCEGFELKDIDYRCYTAKDSEKYYLVNKEQLNFCKKEGYVINKK